jgi:hypothetical protein
MALVIGKVDALLRLGRAAIPARLRAGQQADQAQQEEAHQLGTHGGMIAPRGMLLGALVGRLAHVVAMRAGRIHGDLCGQAGVGHQFFQHAVGGGAAADVAHADHEDADGAGLRALGQVGQGG